jgi:hypothetical protein
VVRRRIAAGATVTLVAAGLRDASGNTSGEERALTVGHVAKATWPPNMGVGGGRTPGPGGQGEFPP